MLSDFEISLSEIEQVIQNSSYAMNQKVVMSE